MNALSTPRAEGAAPAASAFLPRIEALRGFAALAVAWVHASVIVNVADGHPMSSLTRMALLGIRLSIWATSGRAAVIVFFVISGLVLSLMIDAAASRGLMRDYVGFLVRRAFRIYPAHLASLILFVPLAAFTLFGIRVADPPFVAGLALDLRWWFDGTIYGHINRLELLRTGFLYDQFYNGVTWSLRVEMQACLVVPLLVWLTRRRSLAVDLGTFALLVGCAALVDASVRPDAVFLYLPAFHLGATAAMRGPGIAAWLERRRYATGAVLIVCYLVAVLPAALVRSGDGYWMTMDMSVGAFGMVILVAWGRLGRLDAVLLNPASRTIGRLSYSFYLWHWLVLVSAMRILLILLPGETILGPLNKILFFAVATSTILFAFAIAALSYRWIERPFMILGRWLVEGSRRRLSEPADVPLAAEAATAP